MLRFVRIVFAVIAAAVAIGVVHKTLGLGEFLGPGLWRELVDLGLLVAGILLVSLSDRELFWMAPPKGKRSERHPHTPA
jgi:hypothetical protein